MIYQKIEETEDQKRVAETENERESVIGIERGGERGKGSTDIKGVRAMIAQDEIDTLLDQINEEIPLHMTNVVIE